MSDHIHFAEINYGFEFGDARIERVCSDAKKGWVIIELKTRKEDLQIYVTKTGKVRIHGNNNIEWKPVEEER